LIGCRIISEILLKFMLITLRNIDTSWLNALKIGCDGFYEVLHRRIDNVFGRCFSLCIGNFEGFEHPIQASENPHIEFDNSVN